ncbi:MAG: hypothetical protein WCG27_01110 [Pseudomonadota bacterium]
MKIIFFTNDKKIEKLVAEMPKDREIVITRTVDDLEKIIDGSDGVLLFIDYDADKKLAEKVNQAFLENPLVKRLIISEKLTLRDFKKFQKAEESADGYFKKPLTKKILNGIIEDYQLMFNIEDDASNKVGEGTETRIGNMLFNQVHDEMSKVSSPVIERTALKGKAPQQMPRPAEMQEVDTETKMNSERLAEETKQAASGVQEMEIPAPPPDQNFADSGEADLEFSAQSSPDIEVDNQNDIEIEGSSDNEKPATMIKSKESSVSQSMALKTAHTQVNTKVPEKNNMAGPRGKKAEIGENSIQLEENSSPEVNIEEVEPSQGHASVGLELDKLQENSGPQVRTSVLDAADGDLILEDAQDSVPDAISVNLETDSQDSLSIQPAKVPSVETEGESVDLSAEIDFSAQEGNNSDDEAGTKISTSAGGSVNFDLSKQITIENSGEDDPMATTVTPSPTQPDNQFIDNVDLSAEISVAEGTGSQISIEEVEAFPDSPEINDADFSPNDIDNDKTIAVPDLPMDSNVGEITALESSGDIDADLLADMGKENISEIPGIVEEDSTSTPNERVPDDHFSMDQSSYARLQATIRHLREEREEFLKQVGELKKEKKDDQSEKLGFQAELEELKIELSILKKRQTDEVAELKYKLRMADEKKSIYGERNKGLQREVENMQQRLRMDINKVKERERQLEGQLELMAMDTAGQIQGRDNKILELKRKIDSLEFNMENMSILEQRAKEDKQKLEEKLQKVLNTLRGSIKLMEEDMEIDKILLNSLEVKNNP